METERSKILIIDDTPVNIQLLGESLEKDYTVQIATNGKKGLLLAEQSPPDLILLDIMMPEMDGNQVYDALKQNEALQDIPVIFITALGEVETEIQSLSQGAIDYLHKPINIEIARLRIKNFMERENLRKELASKEQQQRLAASVFKYSHDGILITDNNNHIIDANDSFTRITGYELSDIKGKDPKFLKSGKQPLQFYQRMWTQLLRHNHWEGELWNRDKHNRFFAIQSSISVIREPSGKIDHFVAVFSDVTLRKTHEEALKRIAYFDELTGLPNRTLLADRIEHGMAQTQRNGKTMAICYLDLDSFKPVNDRFGHDMGDKLLVEVTQRMMKCLRKIDTLCRIGGDEFVILLLDLNNESEYINSVERILTSLQKPFLIKEQAISISASIGITLYPRDNHNPDQLLRHADQAMYIAKQKGKNQFYPFDTSQNQEAVELAKTIDRINNALENHEFKLYYQPKVNLRTGKPIGTEALIRWQHPEEGLLTPAHFLPFIDNSDLMVRLSNWVLDSALNQLEQWSKEDIDLSISVNIAPCHLIQKDFVEQLKQHLNNYPNVSAHQLELEILETAALSDIATVCDTMRSCMLLGVNFALDDFGTGYSTLTYLKNLPAQILKIDQTFIRDMLVDPDDRAIVIGTLGLAKAFQRKVVAEGVESIAHGKELLEIGCEIAQGYAIARPMPAQDIKVWLEHWKTVKSPFT